ncbi:MAG: DNA repair protein RecO [Candidatus Thiodiazotropha sp. (ex Gloverina cf. vestifex)]|nr:DNA repair protein RecO [Candidatus Thiodiazotropha sp. (ex Gloverina cf. vestifex)]
MTRHELFPACIIHRRDYRNTSLLLELFTPHEGRLPAIAKGAKSTRSNRSVVLQPFVPLLVSLSGRGEIKQLIHVELEGRPQTLSREKLYCGFYLNELLMRLLERKDPFPTLYVHYVHTLERLASHESADQCLREFELVLLQELGYGLLLDHTADTGEPVMAEESYHYVVEQGPYKFSDAKLDDLLHGRTLLHLHNRKNLDEQGVAEAKRLMRRILAFYLGDKPLKSRELFQGLK